VVCIVVTFNRDHHGYCITFTFSFTFYVFMYAMLNFMITVIIVITVLISVHSSCQSFRIACTVTAAFAHSIYYCYSFSLLPVVD